MNDRVLKGVSSHEKYAKTREIFEFIDESKVKLSDERLMDIGMAVIHMWDTIVDNLYLMSHFLQFPNCSVCLQGRSIIVNRMHGY